MIDPDSTWYHAPCGDKCPWCHGNDYFEPADADDAEMILCRSHLAEYLGESLAGLDRADAEQMADAASLGYFD